MIIGTHCSCTGESLVWWQRPFTGLINKFKQRQSRTLVEQLDNGVKLFDLHITYYRNNWYFSNGNAIYDIRLDEILKRMKKHSKPNKPIYYRLILSKNIFNSKNIGLFKEFIESIKDFNRNVILLYAWVEGSEIYPFINKKKIDMAEKYYIRNNGIMPRYKHYAKRNNNIYISDNTSDYLMLDFYEYK